MRNRMVWLMAALLIGSIISGSSQAQQVTNLIANRNPGFENGVTEPWGFLNLGQAPVTGTVVKDCVGAAVPEGPIEGNYCLNVKVAGPTSPNWWSVAFGLDAPTFEKGKKYTLSLWVKSKTGTARINFKPEQSLPPSYPGYGEQQITATEKWTEYHVTTPVFDADKTSTSLVFHVGFAAQEFWVDDCKFYEGDYVPTQVKVKGVAAEPVPANQAVNVAQDPVLSWKAGPFANTHDVYFGASFDNVNTADLSKAAGPHQSETTYKPTGLLKFGQTYYWRIDEVNQAPDYTVFKGDVWSFTVEPYALPIKPVKATASSAQTNMGPEKTIDGSGLDASDLHGIDGTTMWMSTGGQPNWIQYEFDKTYKLYDLKVWNSNGAVESFLGFGARNVAIQYSTDGAAWTPLANVPEFARAPGNASYAANTLVSFGGVWAKYVKLTISKNWGVAPQTGLSEVRFSYIPVQAFAPQPATAATGIKVGTTLDWRPGREAASHRVFFGTDRAAVAAGTAPAKTVTDHRFDPGALSFGTTYYWRVDEVGAVTYPGEVWSFTMQQ